MSAHEDLALMTFPIPSGQQLLTLMARLRYPGQNSLAALI